MKYGADADYLMEIATKHTLQEVELEACHGKFEEVSKYQLAFIPASVRIMHKFDPIPSMGFQYGMWSHGTQYGLLIYDMPGCEAEAPACSAGTIMSTGEPEALLGGPGPYMGRPGALPYYLCESGVQSSGTMFSCNAEYYSYTNMFNPAPCLEVVIAQLYLYDKYLGDAHYPADALSPFIPFEDYDYCATSYTATVGMYYGIYLASDIASIPALETDFQDIVDTDGTYDEDEMTVAIGYWAAWGLIYVHMAYPNYPLCVNDVIGEPFYGDGFNMLNGPVHPNKNGVADSMDAILEAIPDYDEVESWYDGVEWPEEEEGEPMPMGVPPPRERKPGK